MPPLSRHCDKRHTFVAIWRLSYYEVCRLWRLSHYDVCRIKTFVALWSLSFMTFVALWCLSHYDVCRQLWRFVAYRVCRSILYDDKMHPNQVISTTTTNNNILFWLSFMRGKFPLKKIYNFMGVWRFQEK